MAVIKVTTDSFKSEVLESDKPVLVDFNADWCGPCRMLAPIIEEIAEEREDVKVVSVNIDDEDGLATDYGIYSIPCLVVFKDGKETGRSIGFQGKDALVGLLGG